MAAWMLPNESEAGYLEFQGAGIDALRLAMQDQRNAAAEAGAKVLDTGGTESGEARKARQSDQHSSLYSVCVTAAEAVEQTLKYCAYWMGLSADDVSFIVQPKFSKEEVDAAMLQIVGNLVMAGETPRVVLYEALRKAGLTELSNDELDALRDGMQPFPEE